MELAAKYDEDPELAVESAPLPAQRRFVRSSPEPYRGPILPKVEGLAQEIRELLAVLDPTAVRETMIAQLGYYIGRAEEIDLSKTRILEELQEWSVRACGLATKPEISPDFLAKMGISFSRGSNFKERGRRSGHTGGVRDTFRDRPGSWESRGSRRAPREFSRGRQRDGEGGDFAGYENEERGYGFTRSGSGQGKGRSGGRVWDNNKSRGHRNDTPRQGSFGFR